MLIYSVVIDQLRHATAIWMCDYPKWTVVDCIVMQGIGKKKRRSRNNP